MRSRNNNLPQPRRTMIFVYLLLLMLAMGIFLGLRNCSPRGVIVDRAKIGESTGDTIDVAMLYSPLNYYVYDDTLGGYCYDLLRSIAAIEHQPINFVAVTSPADALEKLKEGKVDVIAALPVNSGVTGRDLIYTDSIFTDRLVVVYSHKEGEPAYDTPFSLAGQTIHLDSGSAALLRIRNLQKEIGDTIYTEQHPDLSGELIAMKVAGGDYGFGVVNSRVATDMQKRFTQLQTMPVGFTQLQSLVVNDSTMLRRMNSLLRKASDYPGISVLRRRYNL